MEKLIELLNKYNEAEILDEETLEVNGKYHDIEYLYTKKFGFIKWLVKNEKIELCPISKDYRIQIDLFGDGATYGELGGEYRILMLLSISDTPIEDLISYLK